MKFFFGIKNKLVLSSSLFIILLLGVIAAGTYAYLRETTRQLIFDQQFSMITAKARDLDHELTRAQRLLVNVATLTPVETISNPAAIQKWLNGRVGLRTYFSECVTIIDRNGTLLASVPNVPDNSGLSSDHRNYFAISMKTGKPYISAPYLSVTTGHPVVTMTAPIRGRNGSLIGLLCGTIDSLNKEGAIGSLRDIRIGSSGYLYLFASDRTMIMHPDASRIMKQGANPGVNRLFDKALAGFQGSGETINSKGEHFLSSFKRLQCTDWILCSNYPISEAFQPITRFRNYYLPGMFMVLLAAMALAWKLGIGVSGPLKNFTLRIDELAQSGSDKRQRLDDTFSNELGLLAGSFNSLLDEVQRHELELRESEERLSRITSTAHDGILMLDGSGNIEFWNEAAERMFGYAREEVLGCNMHTLLPPLPFREAHLRAFPHFQQTGQGAAVGKTIELAGLRRDGSEFPLGLSLSAVQVKGVWHSIGVVRDISDRKEAEKALRESEDKFRTVADHIYEWEYWVDAAGSLVYMSPSCRRITGYSAEEFWQEPGLLIRIVHQADLDTFRHHLEGGSKVSAPSDCRTPDFRIQTRSGEVRWIAHVCQEVFDSDGKTLGRRACNRDVTAHKKAEEEILGKQQQLEELNRALHAGEDKLRTLFDLASDAIFIHDYEGNLKEVNSTACERLGYSREEMLSRHLSCLELPEFAVKIPDILHQLRISKKLVFESVHLGKNGCHVPVEVSSKEIELAGELLVFSTARDITERTLFQKKLLKLSKALENSPVTVIITDNLGLIEYVNPKFTEITGYAPEEVIGRNPRILNAGVQPKELYRELWSTILAGRQWRGDFCNRKKNGEIHWDHVSISPIRDEQGNITNFVAIKEDVTEQKRIAEELLAAQNAAHAANRSKTEFLANMSHEIRTPLNAIIGFSALILKSSLPPRLHDYIRKINMAGELLLTIINDILDLSKIEAGRMMMEQIPFMLEAMLENVFSLVQQKAADKGLKVSIKSPPEAASCLIGDGHRLGQIIANLLSNAVKFTEHGEITLEIATVAREEERVQLKFSVFDSGIGISAEQITKLFQPFTQADGSTTRRFGGTGLGLSISKQMVEMMGGEIWCESKPGVGSSFCFTAWFGIGQENDMDQSVFVAAARGAHQTQVFDFSGFRILLVEDNEINRYLATELLKDTGAHVQSADNGKDAVTMITGGGAPYDLVLMDIQMPEMDGYEATRLIRSDGRFSALPIIAMTAHAQREQQLKIVHAGINAHITKPINAQTMLRTMSIFLDNQAGVGEYDKLKEIPGCRDPVFPDSAGLDVTGALSRLDGNRTLYLWLIRSFVEHESGAVRALEEALRSGEMKSARLRAHTIIGTAGSMGAVELENLARSLEKAIAGDESPEQIRVALERFAAELDRLLPELQQQLPVVLPSESDSLPGAVDPAVVAPILIRLLGYINGRDGKAERYLDDYQQELAGVPDKDLGQIRTYLNDFDFVAAGDALLLLAAKNGIILTSGE